MSAPDAVKIPAVVGVIASQSEFRAATRIRTPPDLFELRLDCLPELAPQQVGKLRRPLIVTARHLAEGGCSPGRCRRLNAPFAKYRRELLLPFLPHARFIDVELRSLRELNQVWREAARLRIERICSLHDFTRTPSHAHLQKQFERAKDAGADVFKLVTRAETPDDVLTLLQFLRSARGRCCVMAIGKFGPLSRIFFPECGSVFVYAPLSRALHPGQLTLAQLRRLRDFYARRQGRSRSL